MFPREILRTLVFGLGLLIVAFGVVMGGYALAQAIDAHLVAGILLGVGIGLLLLLAIDAILLLVALGINELGRGERRDDES